MKKLELTLLMTALTKGGKTTIAMTLCHENFRSQMVELGNCRTEITVDWTYDVDTTKIELIDIHLNYKGIFGTDIKERINCEKFSEVLDSNDGKYLKDTFLLEKQEGLSAEELEEYVSEKITDYVNNCNNKALANLIKDRKSNRFLRRIKVNIPPTDELKEFLKEKNISLILRDTRGLLDIDPEEAMKVQTRTMQELGLDGINAVLLLGTAAPFADTIKWYKNSYKSAFESVPVFIMTRPDSVSTIYDYEYGIDDENVKKENVCKFLKAAKEGTARGFREFSNTFIQCYRLLEMFEIGKISGNEFIYNYKVYNNEDLRYVYPNSTTLVQNVNGKPDYSSADYKLYEMMIYENIKDMVNKTIEHEQFIKAINSQIKNDFILSLQGSNSISMYPNYRNYRRSDVCNNILNGSILGPRDGIVTIERGCIKYLGAVTSGVSARIWLRNNVYSYKYSKTLINADGTKMIKNMPLECQNNLIRMALFNLIERNTDYGAYFQGYYFMNRYIVEQAILNIRQNNVSGDALDNTSKEIAKLL